MRMKELEQDFPILKQADIVIEHYKKMSLSNADVKFLERFVTEYKVLALQNKKLEKQVTLLKILLEKKG